jgi:hypothetical protein
MPPVFLSERGLSRRDRFDKRLRHAGFGGLSRSERACYLFAGLADFASVADFALALVTSDRAAAGGRSAR